MISAWLVHLYTASGAVFAFLAVVALFNHDYRTTFFWLSLQVAVDATDGLLARRARVAERIPWFSGIKLDDLVDYLTYVFVPALFVWRGQIVPETWALAVPSAMLLASGYGFSRADAKTADHLFTGFPSYWNLVVFYLFMMHLSLAANAAILVGFAVLVFVPIRYIYPSRTPIWQWPTNLLGIVWGALLLVMLWQYPNVSPAIMWTSLAYPAYYFALSLFVHFSWGRSRMAGD